MVRTDRPRNYVVHDMIGKGGNSVVYKIEKTKLTTNDQEELEESSRIYALKVIDKCKYLKKSENISYIKDEITVHR